MHFFMIFFLVLIFANQLKADSFFKKNEEGALGFYINGLPSSTAWFSMHPNSISRPFYGWEPQTFYGQTQFGIASECYSGKRCARLESFGNSNLLLKSRRLVGNISDGSEYKISFKVKTSNFDTQAVLRIWVQFYDVKEKIISVQGNSDYFSNGIYGNQPWTNIELKIKAPQRSYSARVMVQLLNGTGVAFIDDLQIVDVSQVQVDSDNFENSTVVHYVKKFAKTKMPIFRIWVYAEDFWKNDNVFDFRLISKALEEIKNIHPNAKIIFTLAMTPPKWWIEKNSNQMMVLQSLDNGIELMKNSNKVSVASKKWRSQTEQAIRLFVRNFSGRSSKTYNQVVGYMPIALEGPEWMVGGDNLSSPDFSEHMRSYFVECMATRIYPKDFARFQSNWGTTNFNDVQIPNRSSRLAPTGSFDFFIKQDKVKLADYYKCLDHSVTDTILSFAKAIKQETDGRIIVGTYYGYFLLLSNIYSALQEFGHSGYSEILSSQYLDFLSSPSHYNLRNIKKTGGFTGLVDSVSLSGKMWFQEEDIRTHLAWDDGHQGDHGFSSKKLEILDQMKRNLALNLSKNLGFWWFDLEGGWFDDSDYLSFIMMSMQLSEMTQTAAKKSRSEILVVVDETAPHYQTLNDIKLMPSLVEGSLIEINQIGAPYDIIRLEDLGKTTKDYKLYIFLNTFVDNGKLSTQVSRIKNKNATMLFYFAPGVISKTPTSSLKNITRMNFKLSEGIIQPQTRLTFTNHWLIKGLPREYLFGDKNLVKIPIYPIEDLKDHEVKVLGHVISRNVGKVPSLIVKEDNYGIVVYSMAPRLPSTILRNLAVKSNVKLNIMTGHFEDVVFHNSSFFSIFSRNGGKKQVFFDGISAQDIFNNKFLEKPNPETVLLLNLRPNQTLLFKINRASSFKPNNNQPVSVDVPQDSQRKSNVNMK